MSRSFSTWHRREIGSVLLVTLVILITWQIPMLSWISYPFRLFGTFIHEICHGIAAVITGGRFQEFVVEADLSGLALSAGGVRWFITSAGYVGSAVFGGLLLRLSARHVSSRTLLMGLGVVLGVLCLLFVRSMFGIASGLLLAAALIAAAQRLPSRWAETLLLVLAVELIFDGFNSLIGLIFLSSQSQVNTDAQIMAAATGLPALLWAVVWTAISAAILVFTLRDVYRW